MCCEVIWRESVQKGGMSKEGVCLACSRTGKGAKVSRVE